jgi:peptidoglycan/xylan/chitin deacetylase (PgdA/CDA1 family)
VKRDKVKMIITFYILLLILSPLFMGSGQSQEIQTKEGILSIFAHRVPKEWGERGKGVKTTLDTTLIQYLEREKIAATLFFSGRWIDANPEISKKLTDHPLFEIENHGFNHKPCSAIGRSAYGIAGTKSVEEIFNEMEWNALKIQTLTGRKPKYYRPGTAYCDEICVEIANALGFEVVTFSVRGDAGATYSKKQVKEALWNAPPSSIILMHMNHPESETAEGLIEALPELKKRGFRFAKLSEFGLR